MKMFTKVKKDVLKHFTLFDFVVLIVGLLILAGVFLLFYRKNEFVKVQVKLTDTNPLYTFNYPTYGYAKNLVVGDTETDALGKPAAKIINKLAFDLDENRQVVYLDLELKATYDFRADRYYFRGKPLVYGSEINLTFANALFKGIVSESPESFKSKDENIFYQKAKFVVRGIEGREKGEEFPIEPETMTKLTKGKTIKDTNGTLFLEILESRISPALRIVPAQDGSLLLKKDPFYKDAELVVSVRAKREANVIYIFDDIPLRAGLRMDLPLKDVLVEGTFTEIFDE